MCTAVWRSESERERGRCRECAQPSSYDIDARVSLLHRERESVYVRDFRVKCASTRVYSCTHKRVLLLYSIYICRGTEARAQAPFALASARCGVVVQVPVSCAAGQIAVARAPLPLLAAPRLPGARRVCARESVKCVAGGAYYILTYIYIHTTRYSFGLLSISCALWLVRIKGLREGERKELNHAQFRSVLLSVRQQQLFNVRTGGTAQRAVLL